MFTTKGRIALISVHGDPAIEIGKEEAGGQNVYVRQVGEALSRQGWQVDMFTRRASSDLPTIVEHCPGCRTIRLVAGPQQFVGRDEIFEYLPEFVEAFLQFQQEADVMYPLIHTNYWLSAWVGMELRKHQPIKLLHTYHSLGAIKYQSVSTVPIIANTRLGVEIACLETADRVVSTSPQERDDLRSLVSTSGNIEIIPCGTDTNRFGQVNYQTARQQLQIDPDSKVVLYVGRFDPRKGIETLVHAVNEPIVRDSFEVELMIAGGSRPGEKDGMERDRIAAIVQDLHLTDHTTFLGALDHTKLPTYYAAADVCVVPSHYEPFGLVAIEAMASGTPVVASEVGGLKFTVIPEETGLLVPAQNETAFAEAIHRILSNPEWRHQLGQASRDRATANFSWDGVATQLSHLYQTQLTQLQQDFFSTASVS